MNTIGEKDRNKMFSNNKTREGKSSDELLAAVIASASDDDRLLITSQPLV